jgi:hypothetical protein
VGLAYALTAKGDYILRAGTGIFYDVGTGRSADLSFSFPNSFAVQAPNASLPITNLAPYLPVISLNPPYGSVITAFSPNLKLARSYQWNISLEKSFAGKQVVSATYVGQAGRRLLRQQVLSESNFLTPFELTLNVRFELPLVAGQYRRPLASGLQALLNCTWAHSLIVLRRFCAGPIE